MTVLKVIIAPDLRLKIVANSVEVVDDDVRKIAYDMLDTIYEYNGIGLAATQVDVNKRIVVMDLSHNESEREGDGEEKKERQHGTKPLFFINPQIISVSETFSSYKEGCLSIPGFFYEVERPESCVVKYLDMTGQPKEEKCEGLLSTCMQHEIDHLNGILFLEHISALKRERVLIKLKKQKIDGSI